MIEQVMRCKRTCEIEYMGSREPQVLCVEGKRDHATGQISLTADFPREVQCVEHAKECMSDMLCEVIECMFGCDHDKDGQHHVC